MQKSLNQLVSNLEQDLAVDEDTLATYEQAASECEFLANFLHDFPHGPSLETLSNILRERGVEFMDFLESAGVVCGKNGDFPHASEVLRRRSDILRGEAKALKSHQEKLEKRIQAASEISQSCFQPTKNDKNEIITGEHGDLVDIREEYVEPPPRDETATAPPPNRIVSVSPLSKMSELSDEITALLDAAEQEEKGVSKLSENELIAQKSPAKKVSFDDKVDLKIIEHRSESPIYQQHNYDTDETSSSEEEEDDDDDFREPSSVLGIPRHVLEQYLTRAPNNQRVEPSTTVPLSPLKLKHSNTDEKGVHLLDRISERDEGDEEEFDPDDLDTALQQREINLAYLKHRKRYDARLEQEYFQRDVEPEQFYTEHAYRQRELVQQEIEKSLSQSTSGSSTSFAGKENVLINPSSEPLEADIESEQPKKLSKFKAAMRMKKSR